MAEINFLSSQEVGEEIGVDRKTVLRWARHGKFPSGRLVTPKYRIWFRHEVDFWIDQYSDDIKIVSFPKNVLAGNLSAIEKLVWGVIRSTYMPTIRVLSRSLGIDALEINDICEDLVKSKKIEYVISNNQHPYFKVIEENRGWRA